MTIMNLYYHIQHFPPVVQQVLSGKQRTVQQTLLGKERTFPDALGTRIHQQQSQEEFPFQNLKCLMELHTLLNIT